MSGSVDYMRGFRLKLVRHSVEKAQALTAFHDVGKYIYMKYTVTAASQTQIIFVFHACKSHAGK
jgi:hypothetical protein